MSFFRRKESPAIPPPADQYERGPNKLQRAPPADRYGSAPPDRYGAGSSGNAPPDRYGAPPDRYGAPPDRYGAAPDRDRYGTPQSNQPPAPDRYGALPPADRYGAAPAQGPYNAQDGYGAPNRYGQAQQPQPPPDRYARASPAPPQEMVRSRQPAPAVGDPYSHRKDANIDADRAALFSGYNPEGPRRLPRGGGDEPQFPSEADWDKRRAEGGDEEEDVEGIKQSIRSVKQESLASTRNALRIAREAEENATNTLLKLGDQSEKLGDAERHIDIAKYNSHRAEDKVEELKQLNKSIFNPAIIFNKDKKRAAQEAKMLARHAEEREDHERNAAEVRESQSRIGNATAGYGRYGGPTPDGEAPQRGGYGSYRTEAEQRTRKAARSRYQFEATASDDEIEDELDDNLDEIGGAVGRMKGLALAMGKEVDDQNKRLGKFERKTEAVEDIVVRNTTRLKRV